MSWCYAEVGAISVGKVLEGLGRKTRMQKVSEVRCILIEVRPEGHGEESGSDISLIGDV